MPGGGATLTVLGQPRHRGQLGLLLRRGPHGRPGRLDDAARRERPHLAGHRVRLPVLARAAPVPRALPDRQRRRDGCDPTGTTGDWNAVERHERRLGAVEHRPLRRSRARRPRCRSRYASDDLFQLPGVFVDDIVVSTGAGTTSFENDGDTMDGWTVPGAPRRKRREPERLDRRYGGGRAAAGRRAGGRGLRAPAGDHRVRGELLRATTRSRRAAVSSTTSPGSGSRSRTRPGRSTRWTSSSTSSRPRTSSSTSSRTSGTATASPSRSGSTSG